MDNDHLQFELTESAFLRSRFVMTESWVLLLDAT